MRTAIVPLVALLTSLAACSANGPRGQAPEPTPASPSAPAEPSSSAPQAASSPSPPAPAAPAQTSDATTAPAPTKPAPGDEALLGTWSSAACGARTYERLLSFAQDAQFSAEDRVSPCPPKVACVWSGIVHRKGSFKRSGDTVSLSVAQAAQGPGAQPFPTTLTLDASTGAPVEAGEGGKPCPYQRR